MAFYQAGDTYRATLTITDSDGAATDPIALTLSIHPPGDDSTVLVYGVDAAVVRDDVGVFHADISLDVAGMWRIAWATSDEQQVEGVQIAVSAAPITAVTFATIDELALRLGRTDPAQLTEAHQAQGRMLLEFATGLIVNATGRDDAWAQAVNPIPGALRAVCLEVVARVMQNPTAARSESEGLGAYSHTVGYTDGAHGLMLTEREAALCRRAVFGRSSGTTMPATTLDLAIELCQTGDIAEFPAV